MSKLPAHELRARKLDGSPYIRHSILVNGVEIHAQILCPHTPQEIAERIHDHMHPAKPRPLPLFVLKGKPGPKKAGQNAAGFLWKEEDAA